MSAAVAAISHPLNVHAVPYMGQITGWVAKEVRHHGLYRVVHWRCSFYHCRHPAMASTGTLRHILEYRRDAHGWATGVTLGPHPYLYSPKTGVSSNVTVAQLPAASQATEAQCRSLSASGERDVLG
jgi:hypothetical protein